MLEVLPGSQMCRPARWPPLQQQPPPSSSRSTMQASALTYPSAEASSVLQRPSAVSMPATVVAAVVCSDSMRLTPPARAEPPDRRMARAAMCAPVIADEHAVSMLTCSMVSTIFAIACYHSYETQRVLCCS